MEITRFHEAGAYEAPGHFGMTAMRLQGMEATGTESFTVGFSTFAPGGGCEPGATPFEKVYVVLDGEIRVSTPDETVFLKKYDSCRIEPGESRTMLNESDSPAKVLVIVPRV